MSCNIDREIMKRAIKLAKQEVKGDTLDNLRDMSIGGLKFQSKK